MTPNYQLPLEAETSPGWERQVAGSDLSRRHGHVAQDDDSFIRSCLGRDACPERRLGSRRLWRRRWRLPRWRWRRLPRRRVWWGRPPPRRGLGGGVPPPGAWGWGRV